MGEQLLDRDPFLGVCLQHQVQQIQGALNKKNQVKKYAKEPSRPLTSTGFL
jgi:hypothetical protein